MRKFIEKLQSKEEGARKRIFYGSLVVSMVFVGFVWVLSLGYRFNSETKAQAKEDAKPFRLFGQALSDTYKNVSASVGNISSVKQAIPTEEKKVEKEKQVDLIPVEKE